VSTPLWVYELAQSFWQEAGGEEPFPRDLRRPIALALPLAVVSLPALCVACVEAWLQEQGALCRLEVPDRPLRACLVARYGHGMVFVDGTDAEEEQRFSLAHELAHFLRDYLQPRRLALARLGREVLEVLDGDRPARPEERVHALLARVPIGTYVHLMERSADGAIASRAVEAAESEADLLAFELLAPAEVVLRQAERHPESNRLEARRQRVRRLLVDIYGLPAPPAARYASILVPHRREADSFVRRLGLVH
jgi:hypothetical protein